MKRINLLFSILTLGFFTLSSTLFAGDGKVDLEGSSLKWTGYHLAKSYEHFGNIKIKSGDVQLDGDQVTFGTIVIDMNSISNTDVEGEKDNKKLVNHLKSDDFFGVDKFPEASLNIKGSEKSGDKNYKITADLTIRGITKEIQFDATVTNSTDSALELKTDFNVMRTDFKVMYGWKLENAVLSGEFRLEGNIKINR